MLELEESIYGEMVYKLQEFKTMTSGNTIKSNPKLTALHVELTQVEDEIDKLLDTLVGANAVLLSYVNSRIEELDTKRQSLMRGIADTTAEAVPHEKIKRISDYLDKWENTDFEAKRFVVDGLISRIKVTSEHMKIDWKI